MPFRRGVEHLERAAAKGQSGVRSKFLKWDAGETKLLRWVTDGDEIATVAVHFLRAQQQGLVCQKEAGRSECELCESGDKPKERGYGIAVWRTETDDGIADVTEEIEVDGEKKTVPYVGICNQGANNFWGQGIAWFKKKGTICDRDFEVMRTGSGMKDTRYDWFPGGEYEMEVPEGAKHWTERYGKYIPDLDEMLEYMASDEWYDRVLRGIEPDKSDKGDGEAASNGEAKPKSKARSTGQRKREAVAAGGKYD